jgi:AraC family transcriptional regulator
MRKNGAVAQDGATHTGSAPQGSHAMKANTRQDYLRRIDLAVALLQSSVEQGGELPELSRLAAAAHLSPFHFHRVYRALAGETVGQTVARLRLLRALHLLVDPKGS